VRYARGGEDWGRARTADGEWRHGYRHIWDYVVERSEHRRAVAFRIQLEAISNGGAVGNRNPKVLPWPRSWQRAAADEDSDSPEQRLLR